ncbi:hypothetical protein NG798_23025 [Ancylothrix sp. C2]|uniref:hypothetical protein n=1 Tax=Ancylothrix sp. D3o TaxID=2953691 RepID=UPI0021BA4854|nr:hypothetical protein [Ancylothrix sp. D3o]MCT7952676.1 hypothetical protein [Ancylothrix sp. D3o]
MRKLTTVLTGATVLMLLGAGTASANERPVSQIAQRLEAQNPAASTTAGTIRGIVRSVVGDVVTIQRPDGSITRTTLTKRERGNIGHLIGRDVVVSNNFNQRITLAPPPAPRVVAPRPISLPNRPPTAAPAVTPRPVPPAPVPRPVPVTPQFPAPAPVIIPQTW